MIHIKALSMSRVVPSTTEMERIHLDFTVVLSIEVECRSLKHILCDIDEVIMFTACVCRYSWHVSTDLV